MSRKSKYYSQCRQDKFLNRIIFRNKKNGFFVDIGAHDGVTISNSLFFEKFNSWQGICIEPNPNVFFKLEANRKSTNINACIGDDNKKVRFTQIEGYSEMLSGITGNYHLKHLQRIDEDLSKKGGKRTEIDVDMITLDSIEGLKNRKIDFVSIDTEGNEFEILKSINFKALDITALVIENNYRDLRLREYLEPLGFSMIHRLASDEVFLKKENVSMGIKARIAIWKWERALRKKMKTLQAK